MILNSLTSERVYLEDGTSAYPYKWNEETVLIRDDTNTVLQVIYLLTRSDVPSDEIKSFFWQTFYVNVNDAWISCDYDPDDFIKLRDSALWDVYGLDMTGEHDTDEPLWDFEEDAAIIRASFRQAYGLDWDSVRKSLPFSEFIALIGACPYETPLGKAVYYRNKNTRPKQSKYNKEQIADWDRLHKAFTLKKTSSHKDEMKAQSHVMDDMFNAIVEVVK